MRGLCQERGGCRRPQKRSPYQPGTLNTNMPGRGRMTGELGGLIPLPEAEI